MEPTTIVVASKSLRCRCNCGVWLMIRMLDGVLTVAVAAFPQSIERLVLRNLSNLRGTAEYNGAPFTELPTLPKIRGAGKAIPSIRIPQPGCIRHTRGA